MTNILASEVATLALSLLLAFSGQNAYESPVIMSRAEFSRGQNTGVLLMRSVTDDQGIAERDLFFLAPDGSRARVFSRSDLLNDTHRYTVRFEDSGWRAELHYTTSLRFESTPDPAQWARELGQAVGAEDFEVEMTVLLGDSIYASASSESLDLRALASLIAADLEKSLGDEVVPTDACHLVEFDRQAGVVSSGADYLDILFRLIQFAGGLASENESCAVSDDSDALLWERDDSRGVGETDEHRRFMRRFSRERPEFSIDPF